MVSSFSMIIQFVAIAERDVIMLNKDDPVSINMFSFIFSMGILVCFFKLTSDILVIYGAQQVSLTVCECMCMCLQSNSKQNNLPRKYKHHSLK